MVGNPPWVTNAELGSLGSVNLPEKSNFQNLGGFNTFNPSDVNFGKASSTISDPRRLQIGAEYKF